MRYETVDEITFLDINGNATTIKDMREYEEQSSILAVNVLGSSQIDEIAARDEIYGRESEFESYKIADMNIVKLADNDFNLSKIKKLEVPR